MARHLIPTRSWRVPGRKRLPYDERFTYHAGVDMSGGSSDNACLAIVHLDESGRVVLDCLMNQGAAHPSILATPSRAFA